MLIQVYMPYYDNSEISTAAFEMEIGLLNTIINENKLKYELLIMGDFNCDLHNKKQTPNTKLLKKIMKEQSLAPLDLHFKQHFDFTYFKMTDDGIVTSWPDHIFGSLNNNNLKTAQLLPIGNNFGDHRGLAVQYELNMAATHPSGINKKENKTKMYWNNGYRCQQYSNEMTNLLMTHKDILNDLTSIQDIREARTKLTKAFTLICNCLKEASIRCIADDTKNNKNKFWWNPALRQIHEDVCLAYRNYKANEKNNQAKRKYYEIKKLFRAQKRLAIKLK